MNLAILSTLFCSYFVKTCESSSHFSEMMYTKMDLKYFLSYYSELKTQHSTPSKFKCGSICTKLKNSAQGCDGFAFNETRGTCETLNFTCQAAVSVEEEVDAIVYVEKVDGCPPCWERRGASCYLFVELLTTWFVARDHCHSLGGFIASINSVEEHNFVKDSALARSLKNKWVWLGALREDTSTWLWLSTELWVEVVTLFSDTGAGQKCLGTLSDDTWYSLGCDGAAHFMCEAPAN